MQATPMQGDVVPQGFLVSEAEAAQTLQTRQSKKSRIVRSGIGFENSRVMNFIPLARQYELLVLVSAARGLVTPSLLRVCDDLATASPQGRMTCCSRRLVLH
jgi:hypothetical protein